MSNKRTVRKKPVVQKEKKQDKQRVLSIFPTDLGTLSKEERASLVFKPTGMAQSVLDALRRHGTEAGERRERVFEQVKAKFNKASEATIRTQIYRGIVYFRTLSPSRAVIQK